MSSLEENKTRGEFNYSRFYFVPGFVSFAHPEILRPSNRQYRKVEQAKTGSRMNQGYQNKREIGLQLISNQILIDP